MNWMSFNRGSASAQLLHPPPSGLASCNVIDSICNPRDHHSIPYDQPLSSGTREAILFQADVEEQPSAWNSSTSASCRTMSALPTAVHELTEAPRQKAADLVEYIPYQCDYCHRTKQSTCGVVNSRPRIRSESTAACLCVSAVLCFTSCECRLSLPICLWRCLYACLSQPLSFYLDCLAVSASACLPMSLCLSVCLSYYVSQPI